MTYLFPPTPEYQQQISQVAGHNTSATDQLLNFIPGYGKESLLNVGSGEEKKDECPEQKSECKEEKMEVAPAEVPVQKNKKKCWICSTKLPLSQQQLGECKCGESTRVTVGFLLVNLSHFRTSVPNKN